MASTEIRSGTTGAGSADAPVFLRQSSGLVKSAGSLNVFLFNVGLVSIGIGIGADQLYGPAFYPGGSLTWAAIIATVLMVPVALTFFFWTLTYPRSGGFYVYMSRSLPPSLGFALSVVENLIFLFYGAVVAAYVTTLGLSPFFSILGYETGSATLTSWSTSLAGHWGVFIVGAVAIVGGATVAITGMQRYFTVQRILLGLAFLGTLATIVILIFGSHGAFVNHFDEFMGKPGSYDATLADARKNGWTTSPLAFGTTMNLIVWPLFVLIGAVQSIGIGGEIKRVSRSQIVGLVTALGVSCLLLVVVELLSAHAFGGAFQGAVAYNSVMGVGTPTPITPYFTVLGSLLGDSVPLTIIVSGAMILWPLAWLALQIVYTNRTMLAWALDRVAPEKLGSVSERYHTPAVAVVVCAAIMLAFLALYEFTTALSTLALLTGLSFVWMIGMLTGAALPYYKRDVWQKSPASAYKLFGIPVMTITGLIGAAFFAFFFYRLWSDPVAGGHSTASIIFILGAFALGLVVYGVSRFMRAQRGLDITTAFKQIPVE